MHGVYQNSGLMLKVGYLQELSWTGSDPGPRLYLNYFNTVSKSSCTGLDDYDARATSSQWECYDMPIDVYYDGDLHGCPWLITTYDEASVPLEHSVGPYVARRRVTRLALSQWPPMIFRGVKTTSRIRRCCHYSQRAA